MDARKIIIVAFALAMILTTVPSALATGLADDVLHYWSCDAADVVNNSGTPIIYDLAGSHNLQNTTAFGSGGYIKTVSGVIQQGCALNNSEFFYQNSVDYNHNFTQALSIWVLDTTNMSNSDGFVHWGTTTGSDNLLGTREIGGTGQLSVDFRGENNAAGHITISDVVPFNAGIWRNLVLNMYLNSSTNHVVYDVYVDGTQIYKDITDPSGLLNTCGFNCDFSLGDNDPKEMTVDEIAFFGRSLTESEIIQLYNSGQGVSYDNLNTVTGAAAGDLQNGLLAWYSCEQSDYSGNILEDRWGVYDINLNVRGTVTDRAGIIGRACGFSGNGRLETNSSQTKALSKGTDVSVSAWIQNPNTDIPFFTLKDDAFGTYRLPQLTVGTNLIGTNPTMIDYRLDVATGGDLDRVTYNDSFTEDGAFHFYAFVYSESRNDERIYEDGVLKVTRNLTYTKGTNCVGTNDCRLTIGADTIFGGNFTGIVDEIGIWNRTLTGSEILSLYNGGSGFSVTEFVPQIPTKNSLDCDTLDINCVFRDEFQYSGTLTDQSWFIYPSDSTKTPTENKLEVDSTEITSTGKQFRHAFNQVATDSSVSFYLKLDDTNSLMVLQLNDLKQSGSGFVSEQRAILAFNDPVGDITSYYDDPISGTFKQETVCESCISIGSEDLYEVDLYMKDRGITVLADNGTPQELNPNSFVLRKNNNIISYNNRFTTNGTNYEILDLIFLNGTFYVDDVTVMKGWDVTTLGTNESILTISYEIPQEFENQCYGAFCTGQNLTGSYDCTVHPDCCTLQDDGSYRVSDQMCVMTTTFSDVIGWFALLIAANFFKVIITLGLLLIGTWLYVKWKS